MRAALVGMVATLAVLCLAAPALAQDPVDPPPDPPTDPPTDPPVDQPTDPPVNQSQQDPTCEDFQ